MTLFFITNDVEIARHAVASGVDRIFVDLEKLGKEERQGHLNTHRADHTVDDVAAIRAALPDAEVMARVNPPNPGTAAEVDAVIAAGAGVVMLPMFEDIGQVRCFLDAVDGRARTTLLLETPRALESLGEILEERERIDEIHVGLNDLHLGLGQAFLFQPLAEGLLDGASAAIRAAGVRFGIGGIATLGEGTVPAELVLGEHVRLGSEMVILARSFHRQARTVEELERVVDLEAEIGRVRGCLDEFRATGQARLEDNRRAFVRAVEAVVADRAAGVAAA